MPSQRLKQLLQQKDVPYEVISHDLAFTAVDIAKLTHVPLKEMAKSVVVRIKGEPAMVVVPANYKIQIELLQEVFGTDKVELVGEAELSRLFPDCEVGAMPPFGSLYGLPVFITESLTEDEYIAFNAGSHSELIKMLYKSYEALVQPTMVVLGN